MSHGPWASRACMACISRVLLILVPLIDQTMDSCRWVPCQMILGSAGALPTRLFGCPLESGGQGGLINDKNNLGTQFSFP